LTCPPRGFRDVDLVDLKHLEVTCDAKEVVEAGPVRILRQGHRPPLVTMWSLLAEAAGRGSPASRRAREDAERCYVARADDAEIAFVEGGDGGTTEPLRNSDDRCVCRIEADVGVGDE
jgi:hypothetical protein